MEFKNISAKDSSLAYILSFLLGYLCEFIAIIVVAIFLNACSNTSFSSFMNGVYGNLILSIAIYSGILLICLRYNKKAKIQFNKKVKPLKILLYITIAASTFFALYPIVTCSNSLLSKLGFKPNNPTFPLTPKNYFISLIFLVVLPATIEEFLFRGIIFSGLKPYGKKVSIILTTLMFAIFHMSIYQTIYPILFGLLLCVILIKEDNIYYCITAHLTNNFLVLTIQYFNIPLFFNHFSYIILSIVLLAAYVVIISLLIVKHKNNPQPQKLEKHNKLPLILVLCFMGFLWIVSNLI